MLFGELAQLDFSYTALAALVAKVESEVIMRLADWVCPMAAGANAISPKAVIAAKD